MFFPLSFLVESSRLETEREQFDKLKEELNEAHNGVYELLDTDEAKQECYQRFDMHDREFTECRMRISEQIQSLDNRQTALVKLQQPGSVKCSYSRRSRRSYLSEDERSRASSARSLRLEAAAKSARLKMEMEFLERKNEARRLKLFKEIAIADTEENAIKRALQEEGAATSDNLNNHTTTSIKVEDPQSTSIPQTQDVETRRPTSEIDPCASAFHPILSNASIAWPESLTQNVAYPTVQELVNIQSKQTELSSLLLKQQQISHLPVKEPPVFTGQVAEYLAFIRSFDAIISDNVASDRDRLFFREIHQEQG